MIFYEDPVKHLPNQAIGQITKQTISETFVSNQKTTKIKQTNQQSNKATGQQPIKHTNSSMNLTVIG